MADAGQKVRTRIYIVRPKDSTQPPRLVKSTGHANIKAHVFREIYFEPEIATAEDAAVAAKQGASIENAQE